MSEMDQQEQQWSVVVAGAGNIGSHVLPLVARMARVARIAIVDPDLYDDRNLMSQDITEGNVGRPKADVQAERLRGIRADLEVTAWSCAVQAVPVGHLRASAIIGCIDSRRVRQYVNEVARRLSTTYIDAGVRGDELLVRLSTFVPGPDTACMECGWDDADYAALEATYACTPAAPAPPTGAPAALGALAAALQALELEALIEGEASSHSSHEVLYAARGQKLYDTKTARNPACRLAHNAYEIQTLPSGALEMSVAAALEMGTNVGEGRSLSVLGSAFATSLACPSCGEHSALGVELEAAIDAARRRCSACGGLMLSLGVVDRLSADTLQRYVLDLPLGGLGLRAGDVFTVSGQTGSRHFQLPCEHPTAGNRSDEEISRG